VLGHGTESLREPAAERVGWRANEEGRETMATIAKNWKNGWEENPQISQSRTKPPSSSPRGLGFCPDPRGWARARAAARSCLHRFLQQSGEDGQEEKPFAETNPTAEEKRSKERL